MLDASALLALLNNEAGAALVGEALPGAAISAVNLSEVVGKLAEAGMPESAIRDALTELALDVVPFAWNMPTKWACFDLPRGTLGCPVAIARASVSR